jgi:hypothetical protein
LLGVTLTLRFEKGESVTVDLVEKRCGSRSCTSACWSTWWTGTGAAREAARVGLVRREKLHECEAVNERKEACCGSKA